MADDYCVSPKFIFATFFTHLKIEGEQENGKDFPSASSFQHRNPVFHGSKQQPSQVRKSLDKCHSKYFVFFPSFGECFQVKSKWNTIQKDSKTKQNHTQYKNDPEATSMLSIIFSSYKILIVNKLLLN